MTQLRLVARRYDTAKPVEIAIANGRIAKVRSVSGEEASSDLPWLAPALVDIQVNGYGGQAFASAELRPEGVALILESLWPCGVGRLCPTLTTDRFDVLAAGLWAIRQACEQQTWVNREVAAIHLEGPYISAEDGPRGAHPREHVRAPDWNEFYQLQEIAGGRIGMVTLAPELPGAVQLIRRLVDGGVKVAIGHTAAEPHQITAAVDAGATLSTHLGNGAHALLPRHPNYIWEQMAEDRLWASIICDGHHLPSSVVRTIVRAKGPERIILISDASSLAGLPPGRYQSGGVDVELLDDGRIVLADQPQLLAGATRMIDSGVSNVAAFAGVSVKQAVEMASIHPCRFLGIPEPTLAPGAPADLVLFRTDSSTRLHVEQTIIAGETRWRLEDNRI